MTDTKIYNDEVEKFGVHVYDPYRKWMYIPPPLLNVLRKEYLYCLLVGFIDGDGNIQKQNKRDDFMLRIKNHSTWLPILNLFSNLICGEEKATINNLGYAQLVITNTKTLQKFKKQILQYNLPLLKRKWDIIDMDFISKYTIAEDLRNKVIELLKQNVKQKDIALICNTSPANVTKIKKLYEIKKSI